MDNTSQSNFRLCDILGQPVPREQVLQNIASNPNLANNFSFFSPPEQEEIVTFLMGKRGIKITYDAFFHKIMNPDEHPERLESILSAILGQPITIMEILQRDGKRLYGESSLIIMDIVVRLSDGAYLDVEIQKVGYAFPGERSCCYAADLIMRQYDRVKRKTKEQNKKFSFRSMKPVFVIIIMESSPKEFLDAAPHYLHTRLTTYDSGAKVTELSNIIYISLDTFHKVVQNIDTPLHAWLTFLSSEEPADIVSLVNRYPEFLELYQELAKFRDRPEDVMSFFSESLLIMDHNTVEYMCEEQKKEIEQLTSKNAELTTTNNELALKNNELASEITRLAAELERLNQKLANAKS